MKLSNKILIGFFGMVLLYILVAFTEIRLKGDLNILDDSNSMAETVKIEPFSYLVLTEFGLRIDVIGSNKPRMEVRSISGDLLKKVTYQVAGDTLTLMPTTLDKNERVKITIYVPKNNFIGISANGPGMRIDSLEQKELTVTQNSGWIRMLGSNKLSQLNLSASKKASFNIEDASLDLLTVQLDSSSVTSNADVGALEGSVRNSSYLNLVTTSEIRLKKDASSRLEEI